MGMKITDRDNEMLEILLKYGAVNKTLLVKIYGTTYYKKRVVVLIENKYINRIKNGIYNIGNEGENYFIERGISVNKPINIGEKIYKRYADASYLGYMLDNWDLIGSREAKAKYHLNRGLRVIGILEHNKRSIFIYKLPSKIGKIGVDSYKKELSSIKSYGYTEVIFLSNSDKVKKMFGIDGCSLSNLYVMPDEDISLMLINNMANINTSNWVISQLYDLDTLYKSSLKMYDFENDDEYIFNMVDYNIAKIDYVLDHIEIMKENLSRRKEIVCICLVGQLSEIKKMFGKEVASITFKTLENKKLFELIQ